MYIFLIYVDIPSNLMDCSCYIIVKCTSIYNDYNAKETVKRFSKK